jgi:hypothetical protein
MFKYIKRRRDDEEDDSENESKLSQPSTSKAEKEVTDKKEFAFTTTVTWPWVSHGLETKISRFHCALFQGKNYQILPRSQQSEVDTSQLTTATYQIKN